MLYSGRILAFSFVLLLPSPLGATAVRQVSPGADHTCALTTTRDVKCWGDNTSGQLGDQTTTARATPVDVAALAGSVAAVGAGYRFTCALDVHGAVWCWGKNGDGQLGNGTTTDRAAPGVVTGLSDSVAALSVGLTHACAVTTAGAVKCWGANYNGQLGDGTKTNRSTPVVVAGLGAVASLDAGYLHTCAVTTAGGLRCWGENFYGQLGDGTTTERLTPVGVTGLASGVAAVALGYNFSCALTGAAVVSCWGWNGEGQLGDGTQIDRHTPVAVSGLPGAAALGAGVDHACAVTGSGGAVCWGYNGQGQVGDGSTANRLTPVAVTGLAGVAAVEGGWEHACAVTDRGGVACWGRNDSGQVGDGSTTNRLTPVAVTGLAGDDAWPPPGVRQVAVGGSHACALTSAGGVECWGANGSGQLGEGTEEADSTTPVPVRGLASGVTAIAAGDHHSCALTSGGAVRCWGLNVYGQLGDGTTTMRGTPVNVSGLAGGAVALAARGHHTCVVTAAGGVRCWGHNGYGQLGDRTTTNRATPVEVTDLASGVASVAAGGRFACALTTLGAVKCWGDNSYGELGDGTTVPSLTPAAVPGLTSGVTAVSAGEVFACAVTLGGSVTCWGFNGEGQSGSGTVSERTTPVQVSGLSGAASVAAGQYHACARTTGGRVLCWGGGSLGELGSGTTSSSPTPVAVVGLASGAASVAAGYTTSCAVTVRGGVQCWGSNSNGQLGNGGVLNGATPGWVMGLVAGTYGVAAGEGFACRLTAVGGVQCWGDNAYGQLGDGSTAGRAVPVDVAGLASGVVRIAAGRRHACALTSAGGVRCWGYNLSGQLGDGTTADRATPVGVAGRSSGTAAIAAGFDWTCAVTVSGGVQCWGANASGQLGDGSTSPRLTPTWALGLTTGVRGVAAGSVHTCALTERGGVRCWGDNSFGELGDGTTTGRATSAFVSGLASGVAAVAAGAGGASTCAVTSAGGVVCWGANDFGELGNGTTGNRATPVAVSGLAGGVSAVSLGADHACALAGGGVKCWGRNQAGQLGDGTAASRVTPADVSGLTSGAAAVALGFHRSFAMTVAGGVAGWGSNAGGALGDGTAVDRATSVAVRGSKQRHDADGDSRADAAVYRPSTGTWFTLDSSSGNAAYRYRGWGVQASGDTPVPGCDFDGDGVVDPTVFRASVGTWFILLSGAGYTTWDHFGWGAVGDTLAPADYDGDGLTDAAVYRSTTGTWYVRPSGGGGGWHVAFGVPTDVPIPGVYDGDGRADIAVYRPSTGTWFVLTSSSGYASYWYRGWGVQASGDEAAPGDYDGDGRLDLCVFRAATGTWFVLESGTGFATWSYIGWGAIGDTVAPGDYDGDGRTDAAVYRASTGTWYVRPSSGATAWSKVFGTSGDVPLVRQ